MKKINDRIALKEVPKERITQYIQMLYNKEIEEFITLCPYSILDEVMKDEGYIKEQELDINGWQMDWWVRYKKVMLLYVLVVAELAVK